MQKRTFATDLRHSSDQQFLTNDRQILAHDLAHELAHELIHEPYLALYLTVNETVSMSFRLLFLF